MSDAIAPASAQSSACTSISRRASSTTHDTVPGVVVMIKGREELFFEFAKDIARDDFALTMMQTLDSVEQNQSAKVLDVNDKNAFEAAKVEHEQLERIRRHSKQASSTSELRPGFEESSESLQQASDWDLC